MEKLTTMNFDEVISFLELLTKYTRMSIHSQLVGDLIDKQAVMEQINDNYMMGRVKALSLFELASLYWVTDALNTQWSAPLLAQMEAATIRHIEEEIALQRKLESERDDRTDDNL